MTLRGILLSLCALAITSAAAAQMTGSRLGGRPAREPARLDSPDAIRLLLSEYAICVIKDYRGAAEKYLATPPESAASDRAWFGIKVDDCLSVGELTLTDASFRGAAYEQLYRIDHASKEVPDFSDVPQIDYSIGLDISELRDRQKIALRQFADCVVRTQPADARSFVLSRIGASNEKAAIGRLMPSFAACMQEGVKIEFGKAVLRGLTSEALFRLSSASVSTAARDHGTPAHNQKSSTR
jgi:hypothetical protein